MGLTRRLLRDRSGIMAVEFALLLPVLLSLFLGMIEMERLTTAARRAMSTAQTVADLVAQNATHTDASLAAIVDAGRLILAPLPAGDAVLGLTISSVGYDSQGTPEVLWSYTAGGGATGGLAEAAGLGQGRESVIMVALTYSYTSPFGYTFGTRTVEERAFARPRIATRIALNGRME